ncbi:MAG TPA: hypothetical protein PKM88_07935, partial [bacterium]|nr:hypothetical protein [bacterium]
MAALPACWAGGENEGESAGGACVAGGDFLATDSISAWRSLAYERHQYVLPYLPGDNFLVVGGYNDWYTHYDRITDKLMREAADVMVSSGMADVGYQYVSIDDCW